MDDNEKPLKTKVLKILTGKKEINDIVVDGLSQEMN
jgi:hypothetical protein